jgi:hypothetical protein
MSDFILKSRISTSLTGRQGALPGAQHEMIFTPLEIMPCSVSSRSTVLTAGISNGVNPSGKHHFIDLSILASFQTDFKNHDEMIFGYRRV